jgi:hypothetical protein
LGDRPGLATRIENGNPHPLPPKRTMRALKRKGEMAEISWKEKPKTIYDKETYQLWWDYLKRIGNYQKVCDLLFNKPSETLEHIWEKDSLIIREFSEYPVEGNLEKHKEQLIKVRGSIYRIGLLSLYQKFGDVFRTDFEIWWQEQSFLKLPDHEQAIKPYDQQIKWSALKFPEYEDFITVTINPFLPKKMIYNEVDRAVKKALSDTNKNDRMKKIAKDEIKRYLDVFDVWIKNKRNRGWQKIVLNEITYYQGNKADWPEVRRMITRDKDYATEIILNIELYGRFPLYKTS